MDFFRRFMAGRYGSDPLNNALLILGIVLIIVARILGWAWMNVFILALLCLCYFRMFSRNIQARYAENEKFMRWWRPVSYWIRGAEGRFADRKTHCYFKCPECGQRLRVPKGKGKIMITCPHCHTKFDRKT